jgi:hypothetical protein
VQLSELTSNWRSVRWIDENRCQAECPICASSHDGTDSDLNLIVKHLDRRITLFCFAGHELEEILHALDLSESDLNDPIPEPEEPADEFSTDDLGGASKNGTGSSNGTRPHGDPHTWKILVYRVAIGILEHDAGKSRELFASISPDILFEGLMKDLRHGLTAGTLNPLPDLSETELDEEMQVCAHQAIADFIAANRPRSQQPPQQEQEAKIRALHLDQLYSMIDEWDQQPWVWNGILPHSSLSIIVGKSETGKSTLIYSLIYAIVMGVEFFGRQCEKGRVLYLAGDPMSEIVAGKIFRALGLTDGVVVVPEALVTNPTGMEQLRAIVQKLKPCLVVADTLAATVEIDVDKYGQSYLAQQPLSRLAREFGPNFLMSHHSQKSAIDSYNVIDAALGSVGVAAVASSRMGTKLYRRKGTKFYTFEMSNLRIGNPLEGEYIVHKLDNGLVEMGGLWKLQNTQMDKNAIVEVLSRQTEPMAKRTLWQELRPKPKWDPFNDALDELFAENKITVESGPRGGKLYKLREQ